MRPEANNDYLLFIQLRQKGIKRRQILMSRERFGFQTKIYLSLNGVSNGNPFVTKCKLVVILLAVWLFKRTINFEKCLNTASKYKFSERV
jgi:hypothetical protein